MVGNLGRIAEAQLGGQDQPKDGNYLYGAFGHDFETRDGRRVMVVALTARQWSALAARSPRSARRCAAIERGDGPSTSTSVTGRFEVRDLIAACCAPGSRPATLDEIRAAFADTGVSWGAYQTFRQLVNEDPRCSDRQRDVGTLEHPGVGQYLMPGTPLDFSARRRASRSAARPSSASTPNRCSPSCSGSAPPRSGDSSATGSSAAHAREPPGLLNSHRGQRQHRSEPATRARGASPAAWQFS